MRTDVTGEQIELRSGPYRALVTEVGAALRLLTWNDRDLVLGFSDEEVMPLYRGAVLAPWPNVVLNGRYTFDGEEHALDVSERTGGHALHGFGQWEGWQIAARTADAVELVHPLWPRPGYPFRIDLRATYRLTSQGLRWQVQAGNRGKRRAPYGCSVHPYLIAPTGGMKDWQLELDAAPLARPERPSGGTAPDFRRSRPIGDLMLDDTYSVLRRGQDGTAGATLTDADGNGTRMTWGRACPWVQVYTCDWPTGAQHRRGLAVEPMTCPPDAFNSGEDLVVLEPGGQHSASWRLEVIHSGTAGGNG